jgi:hypothetical protein
MGKNSHYPFDSVQRSILSLPGIELQSLCRPAAGPQPITQSRYWQSYPVIEIDIGTGRGLDSCPSRLGSVMIFCEYGNETSLSTTERVLIEQLSHRQISKKGSVWFVGSVINFSLFGEQGAAPSVSHIGQPLFDSTRKLYIDQRLRKSEATYTGPCRKFWTAERLCSGDNP